MDPEIRVLWAPTQPLTMLFAFRRKFWITWDPNIPPKRLKNTRSIYLVNEKRKGIFSPFVNGWVQGFMEGTLQISGSISQKRREHQWTLIGWMINKLGAICLNQPVQQLQSSTYWNGVKLGDKQNEMCRRKAHVEIAPCTSGICSLDLECTGKSNYWLAAPPEPSKLWHWYI